MKTYLVALFIALSARADPAAGLQAYFPFNGNTSDASSNAYTLTLSGATLTTDRFGVANSALSFADNTSTASFDYSLAGHSFSIGAWFYQPTYSATEAGGFVQGSVGSAGQAFRLMTDYTGVGLRYSFWFNDFDVNFTRDRSNWLYVVATFDNTTLERKIYLDGQLFAQNVAAYGFSGTGPLQFGFMTGKMDDVRVYDRVLSASEVAQVYAIPEPSNLAAMIGILGLGIVMVHRHSNRNAEKARSY